MNNIASWFKSHAAAILATAIAVAKAGLLGKASLAVVSAIVAAAGG